MKERKKERKKEGKKIERKKEKGMNETKLKVKAIPLQAWTGPEGSRRLRLPDFKTVST